MVQPLEELARAVAQAPDDADLRTVFADALLEQKDPAWTTMGELIVASRGSTPEHARELTRAVRATGRLPSKHFVRYTFAHGLIRRADLGPRPFKLHQIVELFRRPELSVVTEVDLRRAWPNAGRTRAELVRSCERILPPHTRWLGLGPGADIEQALDTFPSLTGLGLFVDVSEPLLPILARSGRITDLELASQDFGGHILQSLGGLPLQRVVIYADGYTPGARELDPFLSLEAFPQLTHLGFMIGNEKRCIAFLEALVKSPLFAQLRSFGVSLDAAEKVRAWLTERHELWADKALFTGPSTPLSEPTWEDAWDELGSTLSDVERHEEALAIREDLVFIDRQYGWYWDNLGESRNAVGDQAAALVAYEQATKLDDESTTAWQGKADVLDALERPSEALVAWTRAVELDPSDAYAHNGLGGALDMLGRHSESIAAYGTAWRKDKTFFHAPSNRGDVFLKLGRIDEAFADYERCLKAGDDKTSEYAADADVVHGALVGMSQVWKVSGDLAKARECLLRAQKVDVDAELITAAEGMLAQLAIAEGNLDAALTCSERVCATEDADDDDKNVRAWILLELGRLDDAETAFATIPDSPSPTERAYLLAGRGKDAEALAIVVEDEPADDVYCAQHALTALLARGVFLQRAGQTAEATACFRAVHTGPIEPVAMRDALGHAHREICDGEWCLGAGAAAAIMACVLDNASAEAEERVAALGTTLETRDPSDRCTRAFDLRRLAHLASISSDARVTRTLDVVEGHALPSTLTRPARG